MWLTTSHVDDQRTTSSHQTRQFRHRLHTVDPATVDPGEDGATRSVDERGDGRRTAGGRGRGTQGRISRQVKGEQGELALLPVRRVSAGPTATEARRRPQQRPER